MTGDHVESDGTRRGRPVVSPLPPEVPTPPKPPTFHVWVNLGRQASMDAPEYPGLVLGWRRAAGGWEAFVTYVVPSPESDSVISTWLDARRLKPVSQSHQTD